jgi:nucleotide-binding universal stress UspA family protein
MKKFIAAFDGLNFCESTLQYALDLSKQCHAHLVGVFLEDNARRSYRSKELAWYDGVETEALVRILDERDMEERRETVAVFEAACLTNEVRYSIHRNSNGAMKDLLEESVYADLLIINATQSMSIEKEAVPTRFVKHVLNHTQCPVLLVPPTYVPFNKVVLLYDGELSSVNAVKSFSYLFHDLKDLPAEVLVTKEPKESSHLPHNCLMKEFIRRRYPKAEYRLISSSPEDEVMRYLEPGKAAPLLVLGSYRRGQLARMLGLNMAERLLQAWEMPLFIAALKS